MALHDSEGCSMMLSSVKQSLLPPNISTIVSPGVLPYMAYTGTCRWTGFGFWPPCPAQGI